MFYQCDFLDVPALQSEH